MSQDLLREFVLPTPENRIPDFVAPGSLPSHGGATDLQTVLDCEKKMNILIVATVTAKILLYADGYTHFATVDIGKNVAGVEKILDVTCSHDLNLLSIVVEKLRDDSKDFTDITSICCDVTTIGEHHKELYGVAKKFLEMKRLIDRINNAIAQIRDIWESLMIELDTKLDICSYVKTEETDVTVDLLELFMYGCASVELSMYLSGKLTEKSLKKLRSSCESSYANMKKIVVENMEACTQSLLFILNQLAGLSKLKDTHGPLGLETDIVYGALKEVGCFFLKISEFLDALSTSGRNFLAFLKWMSATHLRCAGSSPVPSELIKTSDRETSYVMDFLCDCLVEKNRDKDGKLVKKLRIRSLPQYFMGMTRFQTNIDISENPWIVYMDKHPELKDIFSILPKRRDTSLIEECMTMSKNVELVQENTVSTLGKYLHIGKCASLFQPEDSCKVTVSQRSDPRKSKMNMVIVPHKPSPTFYFVQFDTRVNNVYKYCTNNHPSSFIKISPASFCPLDNPNSTDIAKLDKPSVISAQFYNSDTVSFIVNDQLNPMSSVFIQLSVDILDRSATVANIPKGIQLSKLRLPVHGIAPGSLTAVHNLDVPACMLGVSGERKVAVVIANNNRTVVLFEMEIDEEDDDEEEEEENVAK